MKGSVDTGALLMLAASIALAVAGQMLMKWGMSVERVSEVGQLVRALWRWPVASGIACFAASALLWLVVLSRLDLSYVYPMVAVAQVATMLLSWLLLREQLSALRIAGMAVICIGVLCVSLSYNAPKSAAAEEANSTTSAVQQQ